MTFDWQEYIALAQWLCDNARVPNCSEEASYRAAISRAYYAAFQCVLNFAVEKDNFQPKGGGDDHGRLLKHFALRGKGPRRRIYVALDRMRDNRRQADYEADLLGDPKKVADYVLRDAKAVFDALDQLGVTVIRPSQAP